MKNQLMRETTVKKAASLLSLVAALALSGCTMAKNYEQPETGIEANWPENAPTLETATVAAKDLEWRNYFRDEALQKLIEDALEKNQDLKIAVLNVEKSRAQYGIQRSSYLPTVAIQGDHSSARVAKELSATQQTYVGRSYTVNAGVFGYEFDLFGRIRSLSDAALETYLGTEEAAKATRISLIAQVATSYLGFIADRELLDIARNTFDSQQSTYDMMKQRYAEGVISQLDLFQVQTSLETARADIAKYEAQLAEDINALSVLVGRNVKEDDIPDGKLQDMPSFPVLPAGVPSEILLTRPDIMQQEHALRSANANIGAARANFFPSISLTAALGYGSAEISHLFDGGSRTWTFSPSINLPIFTWGQHMAQLETANADQQIAVATYEKTVRNAFKEVADALTKRQKLEEQLEAQTSLMNAATEAYRLSDARYSAGIDSYLTALVAQRSMYTAQQGTVAVRLQRDVNLVELYKVLGGGLK